MLRNIAQVVLREILLVDGDISDMSKNVISWSSTISPFVAFTLTLSAANVLVKRVTFQTVPCSIF